MITYYLLLLFIFSQCAFAQEPLDNGDVLLWDGLENDRSWSINAGGNIALTPDHRTEGNSSLAVNFNGEIPAHGVILKKADTDLDVSFANKMILDIYNSGPPCQLALAFYTDGLHESVPKRLNSGLNKNITFEISPKDFKTSFNYDGVAKNVILIVYPTGNLEGTVYFDNIRIKKYSGLKYEPPGISPMLLVAEEYTPPEEPATYEGPLSILNGSLPENPSPPPPVVREHKTILFVGIGLVGIIFSCIR